MRLFATIQRGTNEGMYYEEKFFDDRILTLDPGQTEILETFLAPVGHYATVFGTAQIQNDAGAWVAIQAAEVIKVVSDEYRQVAGEWAWVYHLQRDVTRKYESGLKWDRVMAVVTEQIGGGPQRHIFTHQDVTPSVKFTTRLHGGFESCQFTVPSELERVYLQASEYLGAHVEIHDELGRKVWEGFAVEVTPSNDLATIQLSCSGYYAKASDTFFDLYYEDILPRKNMFLNPSFEATGNIEYVSGPTGKSVRSTDYKKQFGSIGAYSLKITQPVDGEGTDNPEYVIRIRANVYPNTHYVLSLYALSVGLKGSSPYIRLVDNNGVELLKQQDLSGLSDGTFTRCEFPPIKSAANTSVIWLYVHMPNSGEATGGLLYLDWLQLEDGTFPTPYLDGSFGGGHNWTGAAHASWSYRDANYVFSQEVLGDVIDAVPAWNKQKTCLSGVNYQIGSCDFIGRKVNDAIEYVMSHGNRPGDAVAPMYLAIWEDRIPYIITEDATRLKNPSWYLKVRSVSGNQFSLSMSIQDVFNRVFSVYSDDVDGNVPTMPSEDYISELRYGVREGYLSNGNVTFTELKSYDMQNSALNRYKAPRYVASLEVGGVVERVTGMLDAPYMIRAGDVILLTDLNVNGVGLGNVSTNQEFSATVFVLGTDYDAANGVVRIEVGSNDQKFELLMSRLGISGGLA